MSVFTRLCFFSLFFISLSCEREGPPGPSGANGRDGKDGADGENAYLFEFEEITFSATNNYEVFLDFPSDFVLGTDNVLVYFLWDYIESDKLDVWRLLPQTQFTDNGTLVYNYDFTKVDVRLFLDGNFNLNTLNATFTDNWVARVVVIPGQFSSRLTTSVDYNNYQEVIDFYGLKGSPIKNRHKRFDDR